MRLFPTARAISSVVERFVHIEDVRSSNLLSPTIKITRRFVGAFFNARMLLGQGLRFIANFASGSLASVREFG